MGEQFRGQPRTRWYDYIFDFAWSCLGVDPLSEIAENYQGFGLSAIAENHEE